MDTHAALSPALKAPTPQAVQNGARFDEPISSFLTTRRIAPPAVRAPELNINPKLLLILSPSRARVTKRPVLSRPVSRPRAGNKYPSTLLQMANIIYLTKRAFFFVNLIFNF